MIEMYKIMRGIDRMDGKKLFPSVEEPMTKEHRFKRPYAIFTIYLSAFLRVIIKSSSHTFKQLIQITYIDYKNLMPKQKLLEKVVGTADAGESEII
eukprot:g46513.t1